MYLTGFTRTSPPKTWNAWRFITRRIWLEARRPLGSIPHDSRFIVRNTCIPLIVRKLLGRISDSGATIVGVDIETANRSNRFYGDFAIVDDPDGMKVSWDDVDRTFVYRHVATTPSGIDIVECHDWLGGSGVFSTVALFNLEHDRALESDGKILSSRVRPVLKIQGQFGLGDRYRGNVSYRTGVLKVGPDEGWFRRGEAAAWRLPVL